MVLVEVIRKAYLASIVPVIVNSVLDSHQLIVDIVAFVSRGDFPRSRLGEKQRGKILGAWVTRKMRTIAQFSIRDDDGTDSQITEVAEPRSAAGSVVGVGSSLRNVETITSPPAIEPPEGGDYTTLPTGISEMPATYESSIVSSPTLPSAEEDRDRTPADPRSHHQDEYPALMANSHDQYHDADSHNDPYLHEHSNESLDNPLNLHLTNPTSEYQEYKAYTASGMNYEEDHNATPQNLAEASTFNFNPDQPPPPARYDNKPVLSPMAQTQQSAPPNHHDTALASLPSQQRYSSGNFASQYNKTNSNNNGIGISTGNGGGGGGGLYIANISDENNDDDDEPDTEAGEWRREALLQMNLAREGSRTGSREGAAGDRGGFVVTDYNGGGGGGGEEQYHHAM